MALSVSQMQLVISLAKQGGVRPEYLLNLLMVESGGNVKARSKKSTAKGGYQLINKTAKALKVKNPYDLEDATKGVIKLTKQHEKFWIRKMGRQPSDSELYLMHQQGEYNTAKLLEHRKQLAVLTIDKAAVLNNGGHVKMTSQQFMDFVQKKFMKGAIIKNIDHMSWMAVQQVQTTAMTLQIDDVPMVEVPRFDFFNHRGGMYV